ncbi:MAG: hypothetical protein OXG97_06310 [Candidatus Poribacteria bacterium]|nr:hypothetical protein [Candidatus Poribacteria bacterium]
MAQYDTIVKHLLEYFASEYARVARDIENVEVLSTLNTEHPSVKMLHNDVSLKIKLDDETAILHIEVQTDDSRIKPMPLRILAYASQLMLEHELNVYSVVMYLRPPAGQNDPGHLQYARGPDFGMHFMYKVVRLYALEGESVLDAALTGLLPFTPLMLSPSGMSEGAWAAKCVDAARAAPVDETTRATLFFAMRVFSNFGNLEELFDTLITEDIMQASPFYQELQQRFLQQGVEQGTRDNILAVLTARFPHVDMETLKPTLEAISDLEELNRLLRTASLIENFEAFLKAVEN